MQRGNAVLPRIMSSNFYDLFHFLELFLPYRVIFHFYARNNWKALKILVISLLRLKTVSLIMTVY